MRTTIYYRVDEDREFYRLKTFLDLLSDGDFIVAEAADDYYANHDGWEDSWPMIFVLYDSDKKKVRKYKVELEYSPDFYTEEIR